MQGYKLVSFIVIHDKTIQLIRDVDYDTISIYLFNTLTQVKLD